KEREADQDRGGEVQIGRQSHNGPCPSSGAIELSPGGRGPTASSGSSSSKLSSGAKERQVKHSERLRIRSTSRAGAAASGPPRSGPARRWLRAGGAPPPGRAGS